MVAGPSDAFTELAALAMALSDGCVERAPASVEPGTPPLGRQP
jgi:hypothetical protein